MEAPIINPLRFYKDTPNWSTIWPNIDNIKQREQYFAGIYAGQFYKDFVSGDSIRLQFYDATLEPLKVYKLNSSNTFDLVTSIIPIYITPSGWIGANTIYFDFTLTYGLYYLAFDSGIISDKFIVHSDLRFIKKLIKISYYNSENDYGAIFENNDTIVFSPITYFTGILDPGNPENEISSFQSDRGELIKLRSTPVRVQNLTLCDIHTSYIDNINLIFSCDNITVNGLRFENSEPPIVTKKDNFDICDIEIKLIMKNNSYFYKNL